MGRGTQRTHAPFMVTEERAERVKRERTSPVAFQRGRSHPGSAPLNDQVCDVRISLSTTTALFVDSAVSTLVALSFFFVCAFLRQKSSLPSHIDQSIDGRSGYCAVDLIQVSDFLLFRSLVTRITTKTLRARHAIHSLSRGCFGVCILAARTSTRTTAHARATLHEAGGGHTQEKNRSKSKRRKYSHREAEKNRKERRGE